MDIGLWSTRLPRSQEEREACAELIGRDGSQVLTDMYEASAPSFLREIPPVQILRRIWLQNYVWVEGQLRWRSNEDLPAGKQFINSPYDPEAGSGKKRETRWTGYKVHLTETCEKDAPHLITHVTTTAATTTDEAVTETIHADLEPTALTPRQHVRGFWLYHGTPSGQQSTAVWDPRDWSGAWRCEVASQYGARY
jgi:transposase